MTLSGTAIGDKLGVRFDRDHNKVVGKGLNGLAIIRPDAWLHKESTADGEKTTTAENVDYKETHSQICVVTIENPKYPYRVGDRLFVHYMAWETAQMGDIVTFDGIIHADYVFFVMKTDTEWVLAKDTYIGEPVFTDEVITPNGIFLQGGKKEQLKVKITHVCDPFINEHGQTVNPCVSVGDTAISIDKFNYEFKLNGKKYVRLNAHEIAGTYCDAE